jgi:ABC-type polysaccharide/polyol phosphate export permease
MLPLSAVASLLVQFVLMYAVIVVGTSIFASALASAPRPRAPAGPQLVFTVGMAMALATAYVYFRDTHLLEVGLQLGSG